MTRNRLRLLKTAALALLGIASSATGLGNGYAQDDRPIIEANAEVHSLADPAGFFTRSYWPKPYQAALYRPLASLGFATQWVVGGGRPWVFRVVSILLLVAAGLALFALASRLLPTNAAWLSAAFFMVHPVHVEAVAAAVNQSELVVGLFASLLIARYLRGRTPDAGPSPAWVSFLVFFAALLFKESAIVLIGLVVAAELLLVADTAGWRERLARLRPTLLVMSLGAVAFIAVRSSALGGNTLGTFVAEGLEGATVGQRTLTMLGVVPHWFRLLLWPAHLRGDYSPREIDPAAGLGPAQLLGILLVLATVVAVVATRRRAPVIAFGLTWAAIAIFPVSNVVVPTGVVLAERTLFLASMGMMLAVGGGIALVLPQLERRPALGWLGAVIAGTILLMGTSRSASRQRIWRSNDAYWRQTVIDAPRSYRAAHAHAQLLFAAGDRARAETEFKRAIDLYPKAWGIYFEHANTLRRAGMCADAAIFYQRTLLIEPTAAAARNGLIACLIYEARYGEAAQAAREGVRVSQTPGQSKLYGRFLAIADSAAAAGAPPRTVTLRVTARDTLP